MARWITLACIGCAALAAFGFSLLNSTSIRLDLGFWTPELPLGVLTLLALLAGAVLAGVVLYLGVILPMRLRLRRVQRELRNSRPEPT